jgi:copper homeostasis protein
MQSLEEIIDLGCTRVLTSGLRPNVDLGREMLRQLVAAAGDRITIMPGSGVRSNNVVELATFTGANAFHSSARSSHPSSMNYINPAMDEELVLVGIDANEVLELRRLLDMHAMGQLP